MPFTFYRPLATVGQTGAIYFPG